LGHQHLTDVSSRAGLGDHIESLACPSGVDEGACHALGEANFTIVALKIRLSEAACCRRQMARCKLPPREQHIGRLTADKNGRALAIAKNALGAILVVGQKRQPRLLGACFIVFEQEPLRRTAPRVPKLPCVDGVGGVVAERRFRAGVPDRAGKLGAQRKAERLVLDLVERPAAVQLGGFHHPFRQSKNRHSRRSVSDLRSLADWPTRLGECPATIEREQQPA
jgi:hypothetical protein